tara:strand:+ start:109 stop:390 length:282 start_codon:yes stop_codon:yes gene_type:complete
MGFMKPKIPPAPSPEEMARAQDRIAQEREMRQIKIDKEIKKSESANALRQAMRRRKGRGRLLTKRGGAGVVGITSEPIGPETKRTLLGVVGGE